MSLLRFFKPIDGLPDPRGALSSSIHPEAIAQANKEVQKATNSEKQKHEPYTKYSTEVRAEIGEHATHHGVAATARFSRRLAKTVSESTVRSIKAATAYLSTVFCASCTQASTSPTAAVTINMVAPNTAGSSINIFNHARARHYSTARACTKKV